MADPLLSAYVELKADASNIDAVLDKLPKQVAKSIGSAAQALKPLQDAIDKQEAEIKAYVASLGTITPAALKIDATFKAMSGKLEGLKGQFAGVRGSIDRTLLGGLDAAGKGANSAGYKMIQFGQIIDDLQYVPQQGLRPILNNIMQIAPAIGIALVAVEGLVKAFGGWEKILAPGHTKTEAERMDELAKATEHVAAATDKLIKMKRIQAAVEAQQSSQTETEETQAKTVREAVKEGPQDLVKKGLVEVHADEITKTDAEASAAFDQLEAARSKRYLDVIGGKKAKGMNQKQLDEYIDSYKTVKPLKEAYQDKLDKAARKIMAEAEADPQALDRLIRMVDANPGAFPKGLGDQLREATPAGQKAIKDWDKAGADWDQNIEIGRERKAARNEKDQKIIDMAVDPMIKRFGQDYLKGKGPTDTDVSRSLKGQGVEEKQADRIGHVIADKMAEELEKRVAAYGVAHGVANDTARMKVGQEMAAEAKKEGAAEAAKAKKLAESMAPQMHSIQGYFDKIQTAGKKPGEDVVGAVNGLARQNDRIITINERIARNTEKNAVPRFQRGGGVPVR